MEERHMAYLVTYHEKSKPSKSMTMIVSSATMASLLENKNSPAVYIEVESGEQICVEDFLRRHPEIMTEEKIFNLSKNYPELWDIVNKVVYEDLMSGGMLGMEYGEDEDDDYIEEDYEEE